MFLLYAYFCKLNKQLFWFRFFVTNANIIILIVNHKKTNQAVKVVGSTLQIDASERRRSMLSRCFDRSNTRPRLSKEANGSMKRFNPRVSGLSEHFCSQLLS